MPPKKDKKSAQHKRGGGGTAVTASSKAKKLTKMQQMYGGDSSEGSTDDELMLAKEHAKPTRQQQYKPSASSTRKKTTGNDTSPPKKQQQNKSDAAKHTHDDDNDDEYALNESVDSEYLSMLKRMLLVNSKTHSTLPATEEQRTSTLTLIDNKFVAFDDLFDEDYYNGQLNKRINDGLAKEDSDLQVVILNYEGDNDRIGSVYSYDSSSGHVKMKFREAKDTSSLPISDINYIAKCIGCGGKLIMIMALISMQKYTNTLQSYHTLLRNT